MWCRQCVGRGRGCSWGDVSFFAWEKNVCAAHCDALTTPAEPLPSGAYKAYTSLGSAVVKSRAQTL